MSDQKTTFNMFIEPHNIHALVTAMEYVKQNKRLSHRVGVREHSVDYAVIKNVAPNQNNSSPKSIWFKITVSRPYLIFLIGEKYNKNRGS